MSLQALSAVIDEPMPPLAKVVLISLANEADREGRNAFPGLKRIARQNGIGRAAVHRKLAQLERFGFIARAPWPEDDPKAAKIRKDRRPVCWQIVIKDRSCVGKWPVNDAGKFVADPRETAEQQVGTDGGHGVSDGDPVTDGNGVSNSAPRGLMCLPKPRENETRPVETQFNPSGDGGIDHRNGGVAGACDGVPDTPPSGEPGEGGERRSPDHGEPASDGGEGDQKAASTESLASRWRRCEDAIRKRLGDGFWVSYGQWLTPESDDGERLVLAAPTRFDADAVNAQWTYKLALLLQRDIVRAEHRPWCEAAKHRAKAKGAP